MNSFSSAEEKRLSAEFLERGYVIAPVEDAEALREILMHVRFTTAQILGGPLPALDEVAIEPSQLNDLKLNVMKDLPAFRPEYYRLARNALSMLVGNELAMQRRINLSVQLPGDAKSLLPLHADTWTGDSPYEVVLWVPLVDCSGTQSMYFRDHFIDIKHGEMLIFDLSIPHGNVVNETKRTRWSMNCRFKSLFTPYADKNLGEFFMPITMKAASVAGLREPVAEKRWLQGTAVAKWSGWE